jgi:hypothetical protein
MPPVPLPEQCGPACSEAHTYRLGECALSCAETEGGVADPSWTVRCRPPGCGALAGQPCRRRDGTASSVSHAERWREYDRHQAAAAATPAPPVTVYPHADGDLTVLGPEVFASSDGEVICWRGRNYVPQPAPLAKSQDARPLDDLSTSGLHWLINRTTFHPRGLALALHYGDDGEPYGWSLLPSSDGGPWSYPEDTEPDHFRRAEATLAAALAAQPGTAPDVQRPARTEEPEPATPAPTDDLRERLARALYETLERAGRRPWESLSPLLRSVHYTRADAALAVFQDAPTATEATQAAHPALAWWHNAYDRANTAEQRLTAVREALVADGHFAADQLGDDLGSRVAEVLDRLRRDQQILSDRVNRDSTDLYWAQLTIVRLLELTEQLDGDTAARVRDVIGHTRTESRRYTPQQHQPPAPTEPAAPGTLRERLHAVVRYLLGEGLWDIIAWHIADACFAETRRPISAAADPSRPSPAAELIARHKQAAGTAPDGEHPPSLTEPTAPAHLTSIRELRDLRAPLIDALTTVYRSMKDCVGDEWAEEWLGEVWTKIPLDVRAIAGDQDAADELTEERSQASTGALLTRPRVPDDGEQQGDGVRVEYRASVPRHLLGAALAEAFSAIAAETADGGEGPAVG